MDIGGVLLYYSASDAIALSPRQIKNALDSPIWHDYEQGKVSHKECYDAVCQEFGFAPQKWEEALAQIRASQQPNIELINAVKQLKAKYPKLKVIGLSNMSKHDYGLLKSTIDEWGIFDNVITSAAIGFRKPDTVCYESFLDMCKLDAKSCIFVDDRLENVVAAHTLGFQGVIFSDTKSLITKLNNFLGDPVARGISYLKKNAGNHICEFNTGEIHRDNYSQLLILENTGDRYGFKMVVQHIGSVTNSASVTWLLLRTPGLHGITLLGNRISPTQSIEMIQTRHRWRW